MPIEPFVPAKPGDPILAEKWNAIQVTIRTQLEDLSAKKLNAAGGTIGGELVVGKALLAPTVGVGLGADVPTAPLDVRNIALVSNSKAGGLRLTTGWTGFPDTGGDRAEIAADMGAQALMIVGMRAGALANPDLAWPGTGRRVKVWDRLEIAGHLLSEQTLGVKIPATQKPTQELHVGGRMYLEQGVIQRGGAAIVGTTDLGLYSQYAGSPVRVVTNNAPVRFFADSGFGTTSNLDVAPTGDVKARGNLVAGGRVGVGIDGPQELVHISAASGNVGLRIQTGSNNGDASAIRFYHGNDQKAFVATTPNGRFSVSNALSVWNGKVGVALGVDVDAAAPLEVRGDVQFSRTSGGGGIRFNSQHVGWANEVKDRAEISIDPNYKTLMIIGSVTAAMEDAGMKWPSQGRRVSIWDRLEVNGHLLSSTLSVNMGPSQQPVQQLHVGGRMYIENGVIQRGGPAVNSTSDLGLYSQVAQNWIRIVTNNGPIKFFCDAGAGNAQRLSIEPNGDLHVAGRIYPAGGVNGLISDLSLKTDLRALPSALADVLKIRGVRFRWKDEARGTREQVGVVAQDVEAVYPELVDIDKDGVRSVQYAGLVAPLIEAVRAQQQQIDALQAALARLQGTGQA